MLAMFDDMNVTETSKLVSQYKKKIKDVYTNLTDIKSMNLIAKKRNARQENASGFKPYPSSKDKVLLSLLV
jgi:hypothetical protein